MPDPAWLPYKGEVSLPLSSQDVPEASGGPSLARGAQTYSLCGQQELAEVATRFTPQGLEV